MLKIGDFSRLAQVSIKALRYYDETGLLKPAEIDRFTGYRYYTLDQLPRLNRILMLKDLGLSLEQVAQMLDEDLKAEEIRRMLQIKRAELQQHIDHTQARLTRLDRRLKQIEKEGKMPDYQVVIKRVEPQHALCIRQIMHTSVGIGQLFDDVREALSHHTIKQNGPWIALYHHAGYRTRDLDIELAIPVSGAVPDVVLRNRRRMSVRTIPLIETAVSALWQGSYDELGSIYTALSTYIHEHGYNYLGPAREVYLRGSGAANNSAEYLTEIQYPVGEFTDRTVIDGLELPDQWKNGQQHLPFSRRARMALEFAKREAVALQQQDISPIHVLLGILHDGEGFAGHILSGFGITPDHARALAAHGQSASSEPSVIESSRQVVSYADREARTLGHNYIGTEHLLLGLAYQRDSSVSHLLSTRGITAEELRAAVLQAINR